MDSDSRFDLFISFHGSETLLPGYETRELARATKDAVVIGAQHKGSEPSIFFDQSTLRGSINFIFDAVLQTRGGGVALFLLTRDYFRSAWCLAELRAFLRINRDDACKLRFVCLEETAGVILEDPNISLLVPELRRFPIRTVTGLGSSPEVGSAEFGSRFFPIERTSALLAQVVFEAWSGDEEPSTHRRPTILGRSREESFLTLQKQFTSDDVSSMKAVLGIPYSGPSKVLDVFSVAQERGKLGYHDVSILHRVISYGGTPGADEKSSYVKAYERKWVESRMLEWGSPIRDSLVELYEKAKADVSMRNIGDGTGDSDKTG